MPKFAWSFSRWNTYNECPARYKFEYIDKLPVDYDTPALKRGKEIHSEIEDYINGRTEELKSESLSWKKDIIDLVKQLDRSPDIANVGVEQQCAFTRDWQPTGWFSKDTWVRSIYDVAIHYPDKKTLTIVDWKTGRPNPASKKQMSLFATTGFAKFPDVDTVQTRLIYLDKNKLKAGEGDELEVYTRDEFRTYKAVWEVNSSHIENDKEFAPKRNKFCGWCPFNKDNGGACQTGSNKLEINTANLVST